MEKNKDEKEQTEMGTDEAGSPEIDIDAANSGNGAESELRAAQDQVLYLKAEFDNYRKRMIRDQEQAIRFANENLIRDLLSIVDLMDRGIAHGKPLTKKDAVSVGELTAFLSGMEMTQRELSQLLTRFGVEFIGTVGEKFDPNRHEAISELESTEDKRGTVVNVLQKGCLLHGRLISPAKVVVAKSN